MFDDEVSHTGPAAYIDEYDLLVRDVVDYPFCFIRIQLIVEIVIFPVAMLK